eukprot:6198854-Pleurochrysis_carterae.AAC.4
MDSEAAGIAPKEKARASAAEWKSGRCAVGRASDSTLTAARVASVKVAVPVRAARVHQTNAAPFRRARVRCEGVRTTCASGTMAGMGATARRGPPAYSPARKHASPSTAPRDWSHRWATCRVEERGTRGRQATATRTSTRPCAASVAKRATGTRSAIAGAAMPATDVWAEGGVAGRPSGRMPATGTPSPAPRRRWRACPVNWRIFYYRAAAQRLC